MSIFVGNLPRPVSLDDLRHFFESCGVIKKLNMYFDKDFCFIDFANEHAATRALDLQTIYFHGKKLLIQIKREPGVAVVKQPTFQRKRSRERVVRTRLQF